MAQAERAMEMNKKAIPMRDELLRRQKRSAWANGTPPGQPGV